MLQKLQSSRLRDLFSYFRGGDPRDEWVFEIGERSCHFVNGWRSGAALIVDGAVVARSEQRIAVRGEKPVMAAEVKTNAGAVRRIEIYVRAVTGVTIHVRVDGVPLREGFL